MPELVVHIGENTITFPDGTPPQEVAKAIYKFRQDYNITAESTSETKVNAPSRKVGPGDIATEFVLHGPVGGAKATIDYLRSKDAKSINDRLAEASRDTQTGAGLAVGGIGTLLSGPKTGSVAMAGTEALLNKIKGQKQESLIGIKDQGVVSATVEGAIENEVGGKIIGGVAKAGGKVIGAAKEALATDPATTSGVKKKILDLAARYAPSITQLGNPALKGNTRTFSQLAPKGERYYSKALEDILAPTEKAAATVETNKVLQKELEAKASTMSSRTIDLSSTGSNTTQALGEELSGDTKSKFKLATAASNKKGDDVRAIAESLNTTNVGSKTTVTPVRNPTTGITTNQTVTTGGRKIAGPVDINPTLLEDAYAQTIDPVTGLTKYDPHNPLNRVSNEILSKTGAKFDKAGKLVSAEPISFDQAWQWKKDAGKEAFEGASAASPEYARNKLADIYHAIDTDIETGISKWNDPQGLAAQAWDDAKQLTKNKYDLFIPRNVEAQNIADLIHFQDTNVDRLDKIIGNEEELRRFINTGDLRKLVDPKANIGNLSNITTNKRKLLKGYTISKLWQNGTKLNADGMSVPSPERIYQMWQDAEKSPSMRLIYNSAERADISMFFKDLANINQKTQGGGSIYLKFRAASAGLALAGGVAQSIVSGASMFPPSKGAIIGGVVSGAIISAHQLGLLLTNPNTARIMQGMARNQLSMPAKFAARAITYALRGQTIKVQDSTGKDIPATIDQNGNVKIGVTK